MKTLLANATIINENKKFIGHILIKDGMIEDIFQEKTAISTLFYDNYIEARGKLLIPGIIDDQVHFREPGLTHKAEIYTESKAAVAGGVTSFMEMPNTNPQTITQELLNKKFDIAKEKSLANYSFYIGATNDNIDELKKTDPSKVCGIKIFMGSSTGNMLVDNKASLEEIFRQAPVLVAVHCEDEETIKQNSAKYKELYGENVPIKYHPEIRSDEACYKSSSLAVELAKKYNTRLHILHLSSEKELELFDEKTPLKEKRITAEVCVHHLWFDEADYEKLGVSIKWNPAVKKKSDREALLNGLLLNKLDVIATDHAPHTLEEKKNSYFKAPSGGPLVQHSLQVMLELYHQGKISLEKIVEKMCHAPADLFQIDKRGYLRKGYWADIVLVDLNTKQKVEKSNLYYKCKWSPFEDYEFKSKISHTFVNGNLVFENGVFNENIKGKALLFNRN
ncbi:MAG: dihydroorotase [Bacteroidales bacterium]|nr:dihydroorotase [Bacteroidales bacterium]